MTSLNLRITKGKGSNDGTKKSHKFKSALNWHPGKAQEYICAGQKDHYHKEGASYPYKYLIQNTADLIQEFHNLPSTQLY